MSIPDEEVEQVRAATDLVSLVGEHVALRQQGVRFVGLCPFHTEKTPSFGVNARDGFYYCFGCQASGDAISFVRAVEHLDFVSAVRHLAERAGVVLHETDDGGGRARRRAELLEAMANAVAWYHQRLLSAPDAGPARDYLRSRGYDGDTVRRFALGWAPEGWDELTRSLALPDAVLIDAGLAFRNRRERMQDAFRGRIVFPIFDPSGRAIAVGGRVLPPGSGDRQPQPSHFEPKYKNSPETPIYAKRRTLYGLNWAKHDVVATGEVVVCEGYTDVIGCFLAGVPRAVATCGTALGEEHFTLLRNFGRRVVLAYDADSAGQSAIARVYEWERRHEVDVRVAGLPPGADPADLARTDPELLRRAVAEARPFLKFRVERALGAADLSSAEGRARAAEAAIATIAEHPDPLVRDQYLMDVAGPTGLDVMLLREQLAAALRRPPARSAAPGRSRRPSTGEPGRAGGGAGVDEVSGGGPPRAPGAATAPAAPGAGNGGGPPAAGNGHRPPPGSGRAPNRPGLEALRLAVHRPELVVDRLEEVLFADDLQRRAFRALAEAQDLRQAVDGAEPEVAALLRRLSVEQPPVPDDASGDIADPVVAQLVRESARRALAARLAGARGAGATLATLGAETATVRRLVEELDDPRRCRAAADRLVAWLLAASQEGR